MATWKESNGGSFLAGIGRQNDNAPQANDNRTALGLIQQNNEFARQGGNNVGLQGLQGLNGLAEIHQRDQQQKQQEAFQKEYASALKSGDRQQIRDLMGKYPQQVKAVQDGMKWNDDDHRAAIGDLASRGQIAAQMSPDTFKSWVGNNAQALNGVGVDPNQLLSMHQQDPQGTAQLIGNFGIHALGAEKYWEAQDRFVGRGIEQGRLDEQVRSNQASEANTRYGHDVSRANAITSAYSPTPAMKNYSQYQQMLNSNPEGAAAFAASAGINTSAKKLMKVEKNDDGTVTKYFTDGTEESGNAREPISGNGMRKPLNVYQADKILSSSSEGSKASAGFAMRLREGQDAVTQLIDSGQVSPARAAFISKSLGDGMIANGALSPPEQSYLIHSRDIVNAILRRDTGAAITQPETIEYGQMYLPQPGDSQQALETKRKKIDGRFKTFRGESGLAYEAMQVSSLAYDSADNANSQPNQRTENPERNHTTAPNGIVEGATATNPKTGQKLVYRGGQWQQM